MADFPDTRTIPLTQGRVAIVDADDYERLAQFKWCARRDKHAIYADRHARDESGKRLSVSMHRAVIGAGKGQIVDHINHNGLDNRRANLRITTLAGNNRNTSSRKGSSSKYLGVSWHKTDGKWRASINTGDCIKHLGLFVCEVEAAKAYDAAALQYHGEHANPNFGATQ